MPLGLATPRRSMASGSGRRGCGASWASRAGDAGAGRGGSPNRWDGTMTTARASSPAKRNGRPRAPEKYFTLNVYLYRRQHEFLTSLVNAGRGNRSKIVRDLIDAVIDANSGRTVEEWRQAFAEADAESRRGPRRSAPSAVAKTDRSTERGGNSGEVG